MSGNWLRRLWEPWTAGGEDEISVGFKGRCRIEIIITIIIAIIIIAIITIIIIIIINIITITIIIIIFISTIITIIIMILLSLLTLLPSRKRVANMGREERAPCSNSCNSTVILLDLLDAG